MKWLELSVQAPPEFVEPLSEVFRRYGQGGVAVEEPGGYDLDEGETQPDSDRVVVKTYVPIDSTTEQRRDRIDVGVRLLAHLCPISSLQERVLDQADWRDAWKQHFQVLHIGKRIVVVPTWQDYQPRKLDVVIALDPGMAFGTGYHPTTRMCLELLEELVRPGMNVLDLGCGSGILSIAAAKLGAHSVLGLEVDPVAAQVAVSNVRLNKVARTARVSPGTLPHPDISANSFDVAVANISARVISSLASQLVEVVRPGGTLVVSGVLSDKRAIVAERLREAGALVERSCAEGDWVSLVAAVP